MKIGDLVQYKNLHGIVVAGKFISKSWTGIIIEFGTYEESKDTIVLWGNGNASLEKKSSLQSLSKLV